MEGVAYLRIADHPPATALRRTMLRIDVLRRASLLLFTP